MDPFLISVLSNIGLFSFLALSAWLLLICGEISFGQQAYFALGAYGAGIASALWGWPFALALVWGTILGAGVGALVAWPAARLSGVHYAIATLAGNAAVATLMEADGVDLLEVREGALFEAHAHGADEDHADHGHDDHEHELRSISALSSGLSSRLSYDSGRRSSDSLSSKQGLGGPLKRMMAQGVPLAAPHADFADRDTGAGTEFTQEVRRSDLVKQKGAKVGLSYKLAAKAVRKMIADTAISSLT